MGGGMNGGNNGGINGGGIGGGMSSDDVKLIYTDDDDDSYTNIFDSAKTDITNSDKKRLIASLKQLNEKENVSEVVDIDSVINYFVVHNFVVNFDSYTGSMIHNYYLYEEDGVLSMIPWDYNLAFGGFMSSTSSTSLVNFPIDTPVSDGDIDSRPMLSWIFSNDEYTELYHEYFSKFIEEYFNSGYFEQLIDETVAMISPYVEKDTNGFCTYDEFTAAADTLKEFCLLRAQSVEGQLKGTIPSTSDGQTDNSSNLIDASDINISDMGGMGNRGGNAGGQNNMSENGGGMPGGMPQQGNSGSSSSSSSSGESAADAESSASKVVSGSASTVSTSSGLSPTVSYLGTATTTVNSDASSSLQEVETSTAATDSEQAAKNAPPGGFGGGGTPPDMNQDGGSGQQNDTGRPEMPSTSSDSASAGDSSAQTTTQTDGSASSDNAAASGSAENAAGSENVSEPSAEMRNQNSGKAMPSQQTTDSTADQSLRYEAIFLAVSAFFLLLGLLIAYKFKRY